MKLIHACELKTTPWKNGGGVTTEIAIEPPQASLAEMNFEWRISRAEIRSGGPFSKFPGFDRTLMVLGPDALLLNDVLHRPLHPFSFSGDHEMEARLSGEAGVTFDLGAIARRGAICEMRTVVLSPDEHQTLPVSENFRDVCLYVFSGGGMSALGHQLQLGDALIFSREELRSAGVELAALPSGAATHAGPTLIAVIFLGSTSTRSQS